MGFQASPGAPLRRGRDGRMGMVDGRLTRFELPIFHTYFRGMPPRRRTSKDTPAKLAARMRSWRVSLLRGRAQQLGTVEAPDERSAEAAAAVQFGLDAEQRKRVAVREE